jgi:predicted short-subunit dehydrogenase-like oxidoreductase (DUF2520 family)
MRYENLVKRTVDNSTRYGKRAENPRAGAIRLYSIRRERTGRLTAENHSHSMSACTGISHGTVENSNFTADLLAAKQSDRRR